MASISNEEGGKRIYFYDTEGARKAIRLGKVSKRDAETVRLRVEALLSAKMSGSSGVDRETAAWLARIDKKLLTRLSKVGLLPDEVKETIDASAGGKKMLLSELVEKFIADVGGNGQRKPGTIAVWRQSLNNLTAALPEKIAIKDITRGHANQFVEKLKASGKATLTVVKNLNIAKQLFRYAVDWELLEYSPFDRIRIPGASPKNNVEVPREIITRILGVVDDEWKKIIALGRYGGLRTPSETLTIKWEHIDFAAGKMSVPQPKLEHVEGRDVRECPIFEDLFNVIYPLRKESGYVVNKPAYRVAANSGVGWRNANLRTQMNKQLAKVTRVTGIETLPWPRLFHSLRASCQTELERQYPLHVVCSWIGNSPRIAQKSYLMVTKEDWDKAGRKAGT